MFCTKSQADQQAKEPEPVKPEGMKISIKFIINLSKIFVDLALLSISVFRCFILNPLDCLESAKQTPPQNNVSEAQTNSSKSKEEIQRLAEQEHNEKQKK